MDNLTPEQIQQMIVMLQSMLPKNDDDNVQLTKETKKTRNKKSNTKTITNNKNAKTKNKRLNKFDEMMENRMHKEDTAIDKKLIVAPPTPRSRKFQLIDTVCRVCGTGESVNPTLITDLGYKCNKCSRKPG